MAKKPLTLWSEEELEDELRVRLIETAQFVAHRRLMPRSDLMRKYNTYFRIEDLTHGNKKKSR